MLLVAEILRHRQSRQRYAHTHAGGFVHLPEYQRGTVDDAAFPHFAPKVVALAATLPDARENRVAVMLHSDVVNEFLYENRLADARAAEQADFTAARIRGQQVNDLNARFENLHGRVLLVESGRLAVNAPTFGVLRHGVAAVDGRAQYVKHTSEYVFPYRYGNRASGGGDGHAAPKALASAEQHATHALPAYVLADFHHALLILDLHEQNFPNAGEFSGFKTHVHDRPGYLYNHSRVQEDASLPLLFRLCAIAPAEISVISCVMAL